MGVPTRFNRAMDRISSAASPPQRFYTPTTERRAANGRGRESRPRHGASTSNARASPHESRRVSGSSGDFDIGADTGTGDNTVVLTSSSGGIGLSALAAMLAWELRMRKLTAAVVDADFRAGGLDVLLGIENEEGLRFGGLDAPLGRIEAESLNRRLPKWEGIGVLAFDPWNGDVPDWWEIQAAICALGEANDVVVVDGADGGVLDMVPGLTDSKRIVVAELSVLGVARAKAHIAQLESCEGGGSVEPSRTDRILAVVGVQPRGARGNAGCLSVLEASDYLSCEVIGPIRPDRKLQRDLLEGLGIQRIGTGSAACVRLAADRVEAWMGER